MCGLQAVTCTAVLSTPIVDSFIVIILNTSCCSQLVLLMPAFDWAKHVRTMGNALRIVDMSVENYREHFTNFENNSMGKNLPTPTTYH